MTPEALIRNLDRQGEYIGSTDIKVRLDGATLDDRGRFMRRNEGDGAAEELRWTYATKSRLAFGFVNGRIGNAYPPQWASAATCPATITINPIATHRSMMSKKATEPGHIYNRNV
ncbi:hypothetical protein CF327_g7320 [Tilletia walkeri]|nr:hypothetical protein CF327_g7320 [Tilletia walkeri]